MFVVIVHDVVKKSRQVPIEIESFLILNPLVKNYTIIAIYQLLEYKMPRFLLFLSVLLLFGCENRLLANHKEFKRVALVIGNKNYQENSLKNPINDAIGIKETLEKIGFEVTLETDVTLFQFNTVLDKFKRQIEPDNSIVFFYFAGHGNTLNQNSSEEYLMMTDSTQKVFVSIYKIYEFLNRAKARHNIVAIDACRDYHKSYLPINAKDVAVGQTFRGDFRANIRVGEGKIKDELVVYDNNYTDTFPRSTIISYATMHNQMAKDWSIYDREHSPYTRQLIRHLDDIEIPIEEVFRRVRIGLIAETNRLQINLEENSLEKNVWLVPKEGQVAFAPPI